MGVEGIDFKAPDPMEQDDVTAVVGKGWAIVDVGHDAIGGGHDWVSGFAVAIALEAFDVQALVHLPSV
jgi:hypothetical protein